MILQFIALFASILQLRICHNEEEKAWGLMNVCDLKENEGMLFIYDQPQYASFWMFNCYIPLSIAFIDEKGIIQEIHEMQAFPEMMDKKRPVTCLQDLSLYPPNDPILLFFSQHTTDSHVPIKYAIEANAHWFSKHNIHIGDHCRFSEHTAVFNEKSR